MHELLFLRTDGKLDALTMVNACKEPCLVSALGRIRNCLTAVVHCGEEAALRKILRDT